MIEESLFKVNQIGKDGFVWWLGQVAPAKAWKSKVSYCNYEDEEKSKKTWAERCKVRIIGYHTFRKSELSDEDLPWAHILIDPTIGSSQGGEGMTSNLMGGETCFGFFLDGEEAQQPVVIGLLHRNRDVKNLPIDEEFAFQPFTGYPDINKIPATKREATPASPPKEPPSPPQRTVKTSTGNLPVSYDSGFWKLDPGTIPPADSSFVTGNLAANFNLSNVGFGSSFSFNPNSFNIDESLFNVDSDALQLFKYNAATQAFLKNVTVTYTYSSDCNNNTIGRITQALQDFIGFTNGLQKYADTYIDPILNEVVDIASSIKSVASSIGSIIRLIINSIRSGLIKCVISFFKKFILGGLGSVISDPQQTIIAQSAKNILDIIFCLFEKLIPTIIDFIEQLLVDMIDSVISAPLCAVEQWTAGILSNVMKTIEEAIDPIMSGIDWLTGRMGDVFSALNNASSLAAQIYSFIGCDSLKCKTPSKWVSNFGPSEMETDNWANTVNSINVIGGIGKSLTDIESSIAGSSFYSQEFGSLECNKAVNNPTNQDDLPTLLPGTYYKNCIPPVIKIYSPDGMGGKLYPRINSKGSIISVDILSPGFDYKNPPTLTVIDNSGYGTGADLTAIIDSNGSISDVQINNGGSNYCKGTPFDELIGLGDSDFDIDENLEEKCPDGEEDTNKDRKFNLSISANKNKIFEGESFTITIKSTNEKNPKRIQYEIEGVTQTSIVQKLEDVITLDKGEAKIKIDTLETEGIDVKKLKFKIPRYKKQVIVLIEDKIESDEYRLIPSNDSINEGSSFTIKLVTKGIADGTVVPFKISGVSPGLIENQDAYLNFAVNNNESKLKFNTNKGLIDSEQVFKIALLNKKAFTSVLINNLDNKTKNERENTACIKSIRVLRPGIGYNITDKATDGVNEYDLTISPDNGAIFGVKPLKNPVCGFEEIPSISINTNTGIGAELIPIMITDTSPSSSIPNIVEEEIEEGIINGAKVAKTGTNSYDVNDCI